METVSVQIPAALYSAIYAKHEEETGSAINDCLSQLLGSTGPDLHSAREGSPQYPRPGNGTITGRVWGIADKLEHETGRASREAVVTTCISEGININTASTQFSHWRNASI